MSNAIDDGGPAFPIMDATQDAGTGATRVHQYIESGMTLLDYFAARAMQSLLAKNSTDYKTRGELAIDAWVIADTMIQAKAAFLAAKAELLAAKSAP